MVDKRIGIAFRETMTGPFALSIEDPNVGRRLGRRNGTELVMNASVTIDDLNRFITDPSHLGDLAGTIDFSPLGIGLVSTSGVFNLFSPSGSPELKWMVYELCFEHLGRAYYIAGKKEVRNDPGFDLWSDTTTLYTRLHEGCDANGPVVGAGILALGVSDLVRLVSTFRVLNADSPVAACEAVYKFGKFFLGELWDSYVRHSPKK